MKQSADKTARVPIDLNVVTSIAQAADHLSDYIKHNDVYADPLIIQAQINLMQERLDRSQE